MVSPVQNKRVFVSNLAIGISFVLIAIIGCQAANGSGFATDGDAPHITYTDVDVSAGIVPGITNGRIIANDPSIGVVSQDIWDGTGNLDWPVTADTVSVVSTDADDTVLGAGAQTVLITGLDVNFDPLLEIVDMDGLTPAVSVGEFIRVNQILALTVGSYGAANEGLITITHDGNGSDQAFIQIGKVISQKSHFTVPANHEVIFRNVTIGTDTTKVSTYEFLVRPNTTIPPTAPFSGIAEPVTLAGVAATTEMRILNGRAVPGKSDVWIQGSVSAPSGFVSIGVDFFLINTEELVGPVLFVASACEIAC